MLIKAASGVVFDLVYSSRQFKAVQGVLNTVLNSGLYNAGGLLSKPASLS